MDAETAEHGLHGVGTGDGGEDNLRAAELLQFGRRVLRLVVDVVMRAELPGERLFVCSARDGDGFAAHLRRELNGEMTEAADADHSDQVAGPCASYCEDS